MITTTTTLFKRAINTVTGILTPAVLKKYDVGVQLQYSGTTGSVMMWNPETETVASATFEGEPSEEDVEVLFYLGDLLEYLKAFRKKEPLYIHLDEDEIFIRTDDGIIYENDLDEARIHIPAITSTYEMNRKSFIELLHIAQSVTKTTFSESTMSVQIRGQENKLHLLATNLAQFMEGNLVLDNPVSKPFTITLDAKDITRVRNVVSKGKGKTVTFYVNGQHMVLMTETTMVMFKELPNVQHIDINGVFRYLSWEDQFYTFESKLNTEIVKERYDLLRTAEKDKNKSSEEEFQVIYVNKDKENLLVELTNEDTGIFVSTRDLHNTCSKLPDEMEVAVNEQCILLNNKTDERQVMLLIPVSIE